MQYTDEQKARIRGMVGAFEGARRHLDDADHPAPGICAALQRWVYKDGMPLRSRIAVGWDAKQLVWRALGRDCLWLEDWQRTNGVPVNKTEAQRRRARHAWLDKLIADCKAAL